MTDKERRVRTPEGVDKFKLPVGSVIRARRGRTVRARLSAVDNGQMSLFDEPEQTSLAVVADEPEQLKLPLPKDNTAGKITKAKLQAMRDRLANPAPPEPNPFQDLLDSEAAERDPEPIDKPGEVVEIDNMDDVLTKLRSLLARREPARPATREVQGFGTADVVIADELVPGDVIVWDGDIQQVVSSVEPQRDGRVEVRQHPITSSDGNGGNVYTANYPVGEQLTISRRSEQEFFDTPTNVAGSVMVIGALQRAERRRRRAIEAGGGTEAMAARAQERRAAAGQALETILSEAQGTGSIAHKGPKSIDDMPGIQHLLSNQSNQALLEQTAKMLEGEYGTSGLKLTGMRFIPMSENTIRLEGHIETKRGAAAGRITRTLRSDDEGKLVVDNDWLTLQDQYKGKGFASALYPALESWYSKSGVDRVTIHAALEDGGYVWGKAGFDWDFGARGALDRAVDSIATRADGMSRGLGSRGRQLSEGDKAKLKDISDRLRLADKTKWPSPRELSTLSGDHENLGALLMRGTDWYGVKHL